jgi:hypothetical protein
MIYHWELANNSAEQLQKVSHIHLLDKNAFSNKAPHYLVTEAL